MANHISLLGLTDTSSDDLHWQQMMTASAVIRSVNQAQLNNASCIDDASEDADHVDSN